MTKMPNPLKQHFNISDAVIDGRSGQEDDGEFVFAGELSRGLLWALVPTTIFVLMAFITIWVAVSAL